MHQSQALFPEDLPALGLLVEQIPGGQPDRRLPVEALISALRTVERVDGAVLDGVAVGVGRRLARLHGLPPPGFPDEFHADFSALGHRGLAIRPLRQARRLDERAGSRPPGEALILVLGAARLLAADPLIVPPGRFPPEGNDRPRDGAKGSQIAV